MTPPDPDTSIERLIKLAGERDMPTREGMERARLAAHESWSRMLLTGARAPRRSHLKTMLGFAIAAGLAALAMFSWTRFAAPPAPQVVARIATLTGGASLRDDRGEIIARAALSIHSGTTLATSEGRV